MLHALNFLSLQFLHIDFLFLSKKCNWLIKIDPVTFWQNIYAMSLRIHFQKILPASSCMWFTSPKYFSVDENKAFRIVSLSILNPFQYMTIPNFSCVYLKTYLACRLECVEILLLYLGICYKRWQTRTYNNDNACSPSFVYFHPPVKIPLFYIFISKPNCYPFVNIEILIISQKFLNFMQSLYIFLFTHLATKFTIFTYCHYKFHQTLHVVLKISRRFIKSN
jgi:hypothetical protein